MILDLESEAILQVIERMSPFDMVRQTGLGSFGRLVPLRSEAEMWFRTRMEMIQAGIDRVPGWFDKKLKRFDPRLRIRWDVPQEHADNLKGVPLRDAYWLIEHLSPFDNLYHACGYWERPLGEPLFEELRKSDMRRKTVDEHVSEERERAEKQEERNDQKIKDQMAEVIDGMSSKQIENFIAVSEAYLAGDTVTAHGDDLKFIERLEAKNKELLARDIEIPDDSGQAMNPGMHPKIYQRKRD